MTDLYLKSDGGYMIPVRANIRPKQKMAVIIHHGFASSKDSSTAGAMMKHLGRLDVASVSFDAPCHGESQAPYDKLTVDGCLSDLMTVENWLAGILPGAEIGYFASSFGAFVAVCHAASGRGRGRRLFLRSAALTMDRTFGVTTPEMDREIAENGYYSYDPGFGDKMKLTGEFFRSLTSRHPMDMALPEGTRVFMLHGREDTVVDVSDALEYSAKTGCPIAVIPGAGHSVDNDEGLAVMFRESRRLFK